jgi:NAD(P)-dependent dehydrogenase (short-subunit alcohol dehydrogenase family)
MSQFLGRTALVTGAAGGQGRAHAIRLAQEGANVAVLDICRDLDSPTYPGATEFDLADTVKDCSALSQTPWMCWGRSTSCR